MAIRLTLHIPYRDHILRCMKGVSPILNLARRFFLHCPARYSAVYLSVKLQYVNELFFVHLCHTFVQEQIYNTYRHIKYNLTQINTF